MRRTPQFESDDPCIILTHHAPLYSNTYLNHYTADPKYINNPNNPAFHNNLSHLLRKNVLVWLYGHTHYQSKFEENGVIIATNQLGYQHETNKFNPKEYIDLNNVIFNWKQKNFKENNAKTIERIS